MGKLPQKFILDVVPLTKIPLTRGQYFWYLADKNLSSGTLVSVPLFRRKVAGIVTGSKNDFKRLGNIKLKKIDSVIEENFLAEPQLKLAKFISDYYISPLGVVLKNFIPRRAKARKKYLVSSISYLVFPKIQLTKEQASAVNKIAMQNTKYQIQNTKYLLFGPSGSGKTEVYIHSIIALKKRDPELQFLILVPEKTLTPQAIERYGAYFNSEETVVLSSNIAKGKYYGSWQKIRSGEAKIIIGTRMAVFAPFKKLGLIVIDEEQDVSYKQWDMNPRYDARTVAEKLAEMYKCPIVYGSATPAVETYWRAKNDNLRLLELSPLKLDELRIINHESKYQIPDTILVDMKKERWDKNYSSISKKLKSEIGFALKHELQIILFINRQGMGIFSVCEACKAVLKCPSCDRALIPDKNGYACPHCSHKKGVFAKCEKCGGVTFKNVGLGTQKVEKEISNLFPSAKIIVADSRNRTPDYQKGVYDKFSKGEADILIGTQIITKGWDLPRVALIGIIDADNMLNFPDFSANEKTFQNIVQVAGRTGRPGAVSSGTVVIQTFDPENWILKLAAQKDYPAFWEKEVEERKIFGYPPFGKLIKLIFRDSNLKKVTNEFQHVFEIISSVKNIKIFESQELASPKIRGKFRKQLIIKISGKMPNELTSFLKKLPAGWIIDIDPISIM